MRFVSVAVPVPLLGALTYAVPDGLAVPAIGARVLVPLGTRIMTGCVLDVVQPEGDVTKVKDVIDVLDLEPFLPADVIALATWVAEYYACGIGEAVAATMPPRAWIESERYVQITDTGRQATPAQRGLRRTVLDRIADGAPARVASVAASGRGVHAAVVTLERDGMVMLTQPLKGQASAFRTTRVAMLTAQGLDIAADEEGPERVKLGERQRIALDVLRGSPDGVDTSDLKRDGVGPQTLTRLAALGLITLSRRRVDRDPFELAASASEPSAVARVDRRAVGGIQSPRHAGQHPRFSPGACSMA